MLLRFNLYIYRKMNMIMKIVLVATMTFQSRPKRRDLNSLRVQMMIIIIIGDLLRSPIVALSNTDSLSTYNTYS